MAPKEVWQSSVVLRGTVTVKLADRAVAAQRGLVHLQGEPSACRLQRDPDLVQDLLRLLLGGRVGGDLRGDAALVDVCAAYCDGTEVGPDCQRRALREGSREAVLPLGLGLRAVDVDAASHPHERKACRAYPNQRLLLRGHGLSSRGLARRPMPLKRSVFLPLLSQTDRSVMGSQSDPTFALADGSLERLVHPADHRDRKLRVDAPVPDMGLHGRRHLRRAHQFDGAV